uniref:GST N-terminal domain-containing protein n=1 Tax=Zea mays TaxID=4577 RepID=A0A804UAX0_MAIZE
MALVLHSGAGNKNAFKALIAAEYSGIKVELTKDFEMGVSNKTPEFLKMNPLGKVPVLETPDGPVFESNAIARYVARLKDDNPLFGSSRIEQAHVEQWMDFAATEVDPGVAWYLYPSQRWLRHQQKRKHQSQSQRILLTCCHQARWSLMTGRGYTQTQRLTSGRLPSKVSGTCTTQRATLCGSVTTSTMMRTPSPL